ncbi:hypothetical protein JCM18750_38450 [Halostagnicola bangensis]
MTPPKATSDRDELPGVSPSTTDNDDTGSNHSVCVRLGWVLAGEPPACASLGERDLPEEFTFKTFSDWIRNALEEELDWRWHLEMNGVGVSDAYGAAAGWRQPAVSDPPLRSSSTR